MINPSTQTVETSASGKFEGRKTGGNLILSSKPTQLINDLSRVKLNIKDQNIKVVGTRLAEWSSKNCLNIHQGCVNMQVVHYTYSAINYGQCTQCGNVQ